YVVGAPISLHDFLALPEEGYDRDERGRLVPDVTNDDARYHRTPLARLNSLLCAWAERPHSRGFTVIPEPGVVFSRVFDLRGRLLPESFLGPKAVEPDLACFEGDPSFIRTPR